MCRNAGDEGIVPCSDDYWSVVTGSRVARSHRAVWE